MLRLTVCVASAGIRYQDLGSTTHDPNDIAWQPGVCSSSVMCCIEQRWGRHNLYVQHSASCSHFFEAPDGYYVVHVGYGKDPLVRDSQLLF